MDLLIVCWLGGCSFGFLVRVFGRLVCILDGRHTLDT